VKIIGINFSPRKNQTTQKSLEACLDAVSKESNKIKTEIIELADLDIRGCLGCGYCKNQLKCKQEDDFNSGGFNSQVQLSQILFCYPVNFFRS